MKRVIKKILLVIAVIFILLLGFVLYYCWTMLTMPSVETGKIPDTNAYSVNAVSAVYLIETDSGYIMIDAGLSPKILQKSLKEVMIDPSDIKRIFMTHSDGDHTGGLTLFPNAEIYMSADELPLINGTVKRRVFGGNAMPSGIDIDKIILLSDGQELLFNGTKIECIKAPGHTIGSMIYLVDGAYLFTGDAFKIKNGEKSVHPFSMDKNVSKETIERLNKTIKDNFIIFTSHYGRHKN